MTLHSLARSSGARWALALAGALLLPSTGRALTIEVAFTASTYQTQVGDDYASLLAEHEAGSFRGGGAVTTLEGVSTAIHAPGNTTDYSVLMRIQLVAAQSGTYAFQAGVDWGRGGVAAVVDEGTGTVISQLVRTDDLWWNNSWSHGDVFTTSVDLTAGESYTLAWIGFEGCCAGASTIRFSHDGSPFVPLDDASFAAHDAASVPGPAAAPLVMLGLASLPALRRRQRPRGA